MSDSAKFLKGVFTPLSGMVLIFSSFRLFLYAFVPFWISVFLGVIGLKALINNKGHFSQAIFEWSPWLKKMVESTSFNDVSLLGGLSYVLFWIIAIIFAAYFSYLFLTIIGAPFYSLMSERVLKVKGAKPFEATGFLHWLRTTVRMFSVNCLKLVFFLTLSGLLFILSFVPFLLVMIPFLLGLMMAFDCMDFSFECMTLTLKERIAFFQKHLIAFSGLGLTILIVGVIPGLFTLTLPFFIAGCADLFAQLNRDMAGSR